MLYTWQNLLPTRRSLAVVSYVNLQTTFIYASLSHVLHTCIMYSNVHLFYKLNTHKVYMLRHITHIVTWFCLLYDIPSTPTLAIEHTCTCACICTCACACTCMEEGMVYIFSPCQSQGKCHIMNQLLDIFLMGFKNVYITDLLPRIDRVSTKQVLKYQYFYEHAANRASINNFKSSKILSGWWARPSCKYATSNKLIIHHLVMQRLVHKYDVRPSITATEQKSILEALWHTTSMLWSG